MREATIVGFIGTAGSGIAFLILQETGKYGHIRVPSDNGPLARHLDSLFPGFIKHGHSVDPSVIKGKRIRYSTNSFGLLESLEEA